jgi:transcriptional regulator with GAF, ATPase, and Fis domain
MFNATSLNKELISSLGKVTSRKHFLQTLSRLFRQQFSFDRLCINLYDPNSEMLSYFTAVEGEVVNSLSAIHKAEKTTVAGHVIASRKPVVITDISQHFAESMLHPMAEVGLTTTMAFPLILSDQIIGTLHCSFRQKPDNLYEIMEFLLELSPFVSVGLGALLAMEHLEQGSSLNQVPYTGDTGECETFFFESQSMRRFMARVHAVAVLDIPVLILGETGTGKSRLAHYIHCRSQRRKMQFVKVNCPAMASTLFESELFGHAKGAFTGAATKRVGRFELAHQGTLFLDEIAELNQEMQSKLLHVLDDSCFERVGESVSLSVDARLIAATNVRMREAVTEGKVRSDFYYRLSSCTLEIPPLRDRVEDIPALSSFFVTQLSSKYSLPLIQLSQDLLHRLQTHCWPGNVRELRNVISALLIRKSISGTLSREDVDEALRTDAVAYPEASSVAIQAPQNPPSTCSLEEVERQHIVQALARTQGVISGPKGAAKMLGLSRSTLQRRMAKLGIDASASKNGGSSSINVEFIKLPRPESGPQSGRPW